MNQKEELTQKLEREIWLFEQWLTSIEGETGETHRRIRHAYQECIATRRTKLEELDCASSHLRESVY